MENEEGFAQIFTFELYNEEPLLDTPSEIVLDSFYEFPYRFIEDCKALPIIRKLAEDEEFNIPECDEILRVISMMALRNRFNLRLHGPYMFKTNFSFGREELELYLNHEKREILNEKLKGAKI